MTRRGWMLALCTALACSTVGAAGNRFPLRNGQRVLFLGDSITYAGTYVQYVDAFLATRVPERRIELVNLGLSSEGVTGLSEPDHPFPRPDVRERLDRALRAVKPDVVVLCYGMNDGIYYPYSEERFQQYRTAYQQVLDRVRESGARTILMTPPPFDPVPLGSKTLPEGAPKYSWMAPFRDYDRVLDRYAKWVLGFRKRGIPVVDLHAAIHRYLTEVRRTDPHYFVAADGVHPNEAGEWLIAGEFLRALHAPAEVDAADLDVARHTAARGAVSGISGGPESEVAFDWESRIPMPMDPAWDARLRRVAAELNRYRLTVHGLASARYSLWEGDHQLGVVSRPQLEAGLDLLAFPGLTTVRRANEVLPLVKQRERLLSAAWLSHVGHRRPGVTPGLPLQEAQRRAEPLSARIRELCRPTTIHLRLVPLD